MSNNERIIGAFDKIDEIISMLGYFLQCGVASAHVVIAYNVCLLHNVRAIIYHHGRLKDLDEFFEKAIRKLQREKDSFPIQKKEHIPTEEFSQGKLEEKIVKEWLDKKHKEYVVQRRVAR